MARISSCAIMLCMLWVAPTAAQTQEQTELSRCAEKVQILEQELHESTLSLKRHISFNQLESTRIKSEMESIIHKLETQVQQYEKDASDFKMRVLDFEQKDHMQKAELLRLKSAVDSYEDRLAQYEETVVSVVALSNVDAVEAYERLQDLQRYEEQDARIASSPSTNSLIIRGHKQTVKHLADLLAMIDTPGAQQESPKGARSMSISMYFIKGAYGGNTNQGLPSILADVESALTRNGLSGLQMLGHYQTRVTAEKERHEYFGQGSMIYELTAGERSRRYVIDFELKGGAALANKPNYVSLDLSTQLESEMGQLLGFETSIVVPLDEYVILSSSPTKVASLGNVAVVIRCSLN